MEHRMEHRAIVQQARDAGVQLVIFYYCDNGGVIRGKATHIAGLEQRMASGIGLTKAMQAMSELDQFQTIEGMGPVGEVRLIPDPATFTILPYAPRRAVALCDMIANDRQPWAACPRDFLKRMLARAAKIGITFQAAMEPEWYLARTEGDNFVPLDTALDYHSIAYMSAQPVIDDVIAALTAQGLQVEQYYPEQGQGQQEMSITHADALRAADNHILYRETARNVAWQHGLLASFAPKPFPQQAGNGCHIHFSAWDLDGARNLFYAADDADHQLSALAYQFIAGIMAHMPALIALTCPSMNSYRRLSTWSSSTVFTTYGPDNRETALRIPSRFWDIEESSTNLEFRPADSSANPYIALGGIIAAGLDGVERGLEPNPEQCIAFDPSRLTPDDLTRRGIRRLPASLIESIVALQSDTTLTDAMGPLLADSYLAIRRSAWALFSRHDADYEIRHHFYKY